MRFKTRLYDIAVIMIVAVITGLSLISLKDIRINGSLDVFIPDKDELSVTNDMLEAEFGATDPILLSMEVEFGSVLTLKTLTELEIIVDELESNPLIDEVLALVNEQGLYVKGRDDPAGPGFYPCSHSPTVWTLRLALLARAALGEVGLEQVYPHWDGLGDSVHMIPKPCEYFDTPLRMDRK